MSRSTITSSASAGMPGMPRWLDHSPSCMCPPLASAASSQCWASVMSSAEAYSRARRMRRASCTPAPSSVKRRTPSAAISASGASSLPGPAHRDGAGHAHVAHRRRAQLEHLANDGGAVDGGLGVGHGDDRGVAAEGRGRGRRSRPSPPPRGPGWRRWRVQVDEARARPVQPDASSTTARAGASMPSPTATIVPSRTSTSARREPVASTTVPPRMTSSRATATARDPSMRNSTAIRTATPLATWRVITDLGRSATSAAISTPRFMGPGCMTSASSDSRRARSRVSP